MSIKVKEEICTLYADGKIDNYEGKDETEEKFTLETILSSMISIIKRRKLSA